MRQCSYVPWHVVLLLFCFISSFFFQVEEIHRVSVWGEGTELPPSLGCHSQFLHRFTSPEALWASSFWGFMEASLHSHAWLNHWPSMTDPASSPSPFPGGQDWNVGPKISNFNHMVCSSGNKPQSLVISISPLTKDIFWSFSRFQGF